MRNKRKHDCARKRDRERKSKKKKRQPIETANAKQPAASVFV